MHHRRPQLLLNLLWNHLRIIEVVHGAVVDASDVEAVKNLISEIAVNAVIDAFVDEILKLLLIWLLIFLLALFMMLLCGCC